jgi:hypothetical protein
MPNFSKSIYCVSYVMYTRVILKISIHFNAAIPDVYTIWVPV